jgi:hypothetical protein
MERSDRERFEGIFLLRRLNSATCSCIVELREGIFSKTEIFVNFLYPIMKGAAKLRWAGSGGWAVPHFGC